MTGGREKEREVRRKRGKEKGRGWDGKGRRDGRREREVGMEGER